MVVVAASREKRSSIAHALRDLQTENSRIESQGSVQIGDFEMDVANAYQRIHDKTRRRLFALRFIQNGTLQSVLHFTQQSEAS